MAEKTFADALKAARQAAGLSQAALARRAGLTGSYISVLESRRRRPPSPRVIRSLCRALSIDDGPLQEAAALERSPPTVRKRLERMRKERGRVHRTRDRLLTTTLFHLARGPRVIDPMSEFMDLPAGQQAVLGRLLGRLRKVRDVKEAESHSADLLEGTTPRDRDALFRVLPRAMAAGSGDEAADQLDGGDGKSAGEVRRVPVVRRLTSSRDVEGFLFLDEQLATPSAYFWRVSCDDGHPRVEAGDLVLVDPDRKGEEGDLVVFRHDGRDRVGLLRRVAPKVEISFPRPEVPPLRNPSGRVRLKGVVSLVVRRT